MYLPYCLLREEREVMVELETAIRNNMINPCSTMTFMIHRTAGSDPGCVISPLALELESAIVNNIYYQLGHMRGKQNLVKGMWIWTQRPCLNLQNEIFIWFLEATNYILWGFYNAHSTKLLYCVLCGSALGPIHHLLEKRWMMHRHKFLVLLCMLGGCNKD